jgi:hypothetical protein
MQSYPLVGAHERRNFAACSRKPSRRCRDLDLHRFELDCGGKTIGWLSLAAALAGKMERPVSIRAGRMQVDVGPRYYGRRSMPCVVPVPFGPPARFGPPGFYRPGLMVVPCPGGPPPRQFVSLPAGFAPVPQRLVSFASVPDPVGQVEAPPPPIAKTAHDSTSFAAPARIAGGDSPKSLESGRPSAAKLANTESEITGAIAAPSDPGSLSSRQNLIAAVGLGVAALLFFSTAFVLSRRRSRAVQVVAANNTDPPVSHGQAPTTKPPLPDEWLPSTLAEALAVLVASPETEGDPLKELVKRLRRRWHPDHAKDQEDRRARECKLKQINVAWDIVCGKRGMHRPSFGSHKA